MGLGRYEIDTYLEAMRRRIAHIRDELRTIRRKRSLQRARRVDSGFALVSLAGYTYAGKTTLFNRLASESKPVNQGLFTTLSTTTRAVDLYGRRILLTDTVGFIDKLPLALIEAFRSTLEETALSDVIILVVGIHDRNEHRLFVDRLSHGIEVEASFSVDWKLCHPVTFSSQITGDIAHGRMLDPGGDEMAFRRIGIEGP
jgi:GTP-binding protein HflX